MIIHGQEIKDSEWDKLESLKTTLKMIDYKGAYTTSHFDGKFCYDMHMIAVSGSSRVYKMRFLFEESSEFYCVIVDSNDSNDKWISLVKEDIDSAIYRVVKFFSVR